ncbi:hypothetical protein SAMN00790413_01423 [Deinococcus hopiensis KR-140]|uniref:Uncharacterized protein n=1 Tax=Deinococcus hopiensis KR-140 TaxID=695939 RepID=A0A1W1VG67_9DEIO|nr:hypothetical protein SAMN00790413_01423 [Deinococcus hopiensis KR-140]
MFCSPSAQGPGNYALVPMVSLKRCMKSPRGGPAFLQGRLMF